MIYQYQSDFYSQQAYLNTCKNYECCFCSLVAVSSNGELKAIGKRRLA